MTENFLPLEAIFYSRSDDKCSIHSLLFINGLQQTVFPWKSYSQ